MPVTSSISIEADGLSAPVNKELYGLTIEEINHAVEGGLYAELIQNRSFEDGVPPLNCPYDPVRNLLTTPNGWSIPFMRLDSVPGWRRLSTANTYMYPDTKELLNDKNRRSMLVSISGSSDFRGGVVAEGYKGIPVRKGETYQLSLFLKGAYMQPRTIRIGLEDSSTTVALSEVYRVAPTTEWKRYTHTFTAIKDARQAVLTLTADTAVMFWMDVVSLFPGKTWNNRKNGLRPDLMEKIVALNPQFIRFPGGSFVEGYTAGTYPIWRETVGSIAERKHFWNVWAYGTTNGMGYHEYLELCEDLKAEPIYVINSGVTSQSRRPRYEDITAMDKPVQDALDAIAYANEPADSTLGALRARHGHPEPFHLRYIEIGSENYGTEYSKRYDLFKAAIKARYPDITVISSSFTSRKNRGDWTDTHFYSGDEFFIANHNRYEQDAYSRRQPAAFIGEFGSVYEPTRGTLRAAIGEACFLIGAESNPDVVKRLAYAPLLRNVNYPEQRPAAVSFNNHQVVTSPAYHMLQMFWNNRGDEVLKTLVESYQKPQVTFGQAGIELFDNSYEVTDVQLDDRMVTQMTVRNGGWQLESGRLTPDANRWNYVLMGDSAEHDYTFSATIKRTKGSGQIQFHVRDNGLRAEQGDRICFTIGAGTSELFRQAGGVKDSLTSPKPFVFESNRAYKVRMTCADERIYCYVNDSLLHEAAMRPLPSLVSVATLDKENNVILLKVVNTTQHEEKTALHISGASIQNEVEVLELSGSPDARNTFTSPESIVPVTRQFSFSLGGAMIYNFPPNSISILYLKID